MRRKQLWLLALALLVAPPAGLGGHEIPGDVTIQAFLKPEGQRLRLIVRVPLAAMRDITYPKRGIDFLDIPRADQALRDAATLWLGQEIELYEEGARLAEPEVLAVMASLPSDPSFETYEHAVAHVTGPRLPEAIELPWSQGMLDVLFEYPVRSDTARFSIKPNLEHLGLRTRIALRFMPPGGAIRPFEFHGDPGLVRLDPRWHQAAARFVEMGFFHILDGIDHLLFLFCLIVPFHSGWRGPLHPAKLVARGAPLIRAGGDVGVSVGTASPRSAPRAFRSLVLVVTSFTVAHSITLIAAAFNFAPSALWFPPLIETLIALSILYMAIENIVSPQLRRRWMIAFGFGLVHGFGFSFALRETLQFAGTHLLTSLFGFNIGVELGQLLVLVLLVPLLDVLFRRVVAERMGTVILSALVAHTSWHWLTERYGVLRQYRFEWPIVDAAFLASVMRWLLVAVIVAAVIWVVRLFRPPLRTDTSPSPGTDAADGG